MNLRNVRRVLLGLVTPALLSVLPSSNVFAQESFEDRVANWTEGDVVMPAAPSEGSLQEFFVSASSPNRFMFDRDTLTVGADGVVRYVLVIRTPGGAENVTFEGIRCNTNERRIYASRSNRSEWVPVKGSEWVPILDNTYNRPRAALAYELFCDGPAPPRSVDEVLRRLKSGYGTMANPMQGGR
ncbi:MAG: CNP1-like family protein [Azoarcus sp.]|nr:CNP1-like family protein [Azoarcus sp.]MDD2872099.1 CNP1-like family protein [Azoarcus sp.]